MSDWIDVASVDDFPAGSRRLVVVEGVDMLVFNLNGMYYAIEDVCSHDGNPLTYGALEGDEITCPRHGARFCIRTGQAMSAPAFQDIAIFPVRIEQGMIQVKDSRWD